MGKPLTEWIDQVEHLVRDADNVDVSTTQVETVGIVPALGQYSVDRPYQDVAETAGAGTAYLDLPAGWVDGFSRLDSIEYPARQDPPQMLDEKSFEVVRDPTTVATKVIRLDVMPSASEHVRIGYTRPWPTPTATAGDDKVDVVAFNAVTALAASFILEHLASQAARHRDGAAPVDWTGTGSDRPRDLHNIARGYRDVYDKFLGRGGGAGGGSAAPVSRRFDYDPGHDSIFHGGRR